MFLVSAFGRLFGTKVTLVSVGANDIRQPLARRLVIAAARLAYYRSFLDSFARDAMHEWASTPREMLSISDLAFALPTPRDVPVVAEMVGVGVMGYHGLAEFCQSARPVDVDRLIEQFTERESRSTQLRQMIMERTAANARLLNHQFVTLSALLFRSAKPEDAAAGHEHTRTDPF
jgi:polysaccharide pyruvyl transferase WcaK-like protein